MKKRAATGGVQMFSFLDAMICTLGALLVLLHAFARDRETNLEKKAAAQASQEETIDVDAELETLQWRIDQLREVRSKTAAQLAEQRSKLAHIEDHARRLREKARQLEIALAELEKLSKSKDAKTLRNQAELEAARVRVVEARDALEKARERNKQTARYNVVPYDGENSTNRRPVYIECRCQELILQPEGVKIVPEDFAGFFGSGNPLAAALRATSEYYARQTSPDGMPQEEPYALLLVRPDGVSAFYVARLALESWGANYGYELIGADWDLKFPAPDRRLAQLSRQIVSDARQRMQDLRLLTSQMRGQHERVALRASTSGGFVVDRHHSSGSGSGRGLIRDIDASDSPANAWLTGKSSSSTSNTTSDSGGFALGGEAGGGSILADGTGPGTPTDPRMPGGPGGISPEGIGKGSGYGANGYGTGRGDSGNGQFAADGGAGDGQSKGQGNRAGKPHDNSNGAKSPFPFAQEGPGGLAPLGAPGATGNSSADNSTGNSRTAGTPGGQQQDSSGTNGNGGGSASQSAQAQSGAHAAANCPDGQCKPDSIAKRRGRDWGLQDAGPSESPLTRPILVQCYPDRLVIVPEDRTHQAVITSLDGGAENSIDEFVINVWQHTRQWGIPGRGLFWKPTLVMDVAPGGDARFAEIQALLDESGLDVQQRRRPGKSASAPPPTNRTR